jgi:hypothetical protein
MGRLSAIAACRLRDSGRYEDHQFAVLAQHRISRHQSQRFGQSLATRIRSKGIGVVRWEGCHADGMGGTNQEFREERSIEVWSDRDPSLEEPELDLATRFGQRVMRTSGLPLRISIWLA